MPSYKVSNKPRMYFVQTICSMQYSCILLLEVRQVCAFQKLFEHTFTKQLCPSIYMRLVIIIFNVIFQNVQFTTCNKVATQ